MYTLIKNYVEKLTINELNAFAIKNDINLNEEELNFVYNFIKRNYNHLYANPNIDLSRFKSRFSDENYQKITKLINTYKIKYAHLLK